MKTENKNQQFPTPQIDLSALVEPEKQKREVLTVQKLRRAALDPKKIQKHLFASHREPFVRALADFLECQPTMEAIKGFADKSPDRWAQAVTMMARLAGYSEKLEVTENININVRNKSDAEILQELSSVMDLNKVDLNTFALRMEISESVQISDITKPVQLEMFPIKEEGR